jgi:hypothetical protein
MRATGRDAILTMRAGTEARSRSHWEAAAGIAALYVVTRTDDSRATRGASALADAWSQRLHRGYEDGLDSHAAARRATREIAPSIDRTATTETMQSWNAETLRQDAYAASRGYVVTETWRSLLDACQACFDMDGLSVVVPDTFTEDPPIHPHCRCCIESSVELASERAA